jgi:hypothetical protein
MHPYYLITMEHAVIAIDDDCALFPETRNCRARRNESSPTSRVEAKVLVEVVVVET